jgi:hypothetical protein
MFHPRVFAHRKAAQSACRKIVLLILSCLLCLSAQQKLAFAQTQEQEREKEQERQQEKERQREQQEERQQEKEQQRERQEDRQQEQEQQREQQEERQQEQERQREQQQQQQQQEQERQREQQRQQQSQPSNAPAENNNHNNNGSYSRSAEPNATTANPPSHTYTPGASASGSEDTYTPGSNPSSSATGAVHTYTPGASTSGSAHTYTPGNNTSSSGTAAAHTYTPGASASGSAHTYTPSASSSVNPATSAQSVTTYTPHANGSGAARVESESRDASSGVGVTNANGVTTYRPQARPSAEAPQGELRFGGCAKLTGNSACKVCQSTGFGSWECKSNTIWQDIPGNNLPVAGQPPPSTGPRRGSTGGTASAGGGSAGTGGNASIGSGRQVVPGTPSSGGLAPAGCTPQGAPGDGPAGAGSSSNCGSQATGIGAASSGAYPSGVGYRNSFGASQQAGSGGVSAGSPVAGGCVPGDGPAGGGCNGNVQTSGQQTGATSDTAGALPASGDQGSTGSDNPITTANDNSKGMLDARGNLKSAFGGMTSDYSAVIESNRSSCDATVHVTLIASQPAGDGANLQLQATAKPNPNSADIPAHCFELEYTIEATQRTTLGDPGPAAGQTYQTKFNSTSDVEDIDLPVASNGSNGIDLVGWRVTGAHCHSAENCAPKLSAAECGQLQDYRQNVLPNERMHLLKQYGITSLGKDFIQKLRSDLAEDMRDPVTGIDATGNLASFLIDLETDMQLVQDVGKAFAPEAGLMDPAMFKKTKPLPTADKVLNAIEMANDGVDAVKTLQVGFTADTASDLALNAAAKFTPVVAILKDLSDNAKKHEEQNSLIRTLNTQLDNLGKKIDDYNQTLQQIIDKQDDLKHISDAIDMACGSGNSNPQNQ